MFASLFGMNLNVEEIANSWSVGDAHQFTLVVVSICSTTIGVGFGCVIL